MIAQGLGRTKCRDYSLWGAKAAGLVVALCVACCAVLLVLSHFALRADGDLDKSKDALAARGRAQDVLAKIGHRVAIGGRRARCS
jgi:NADH:ubiquinone oxidoreductase subunit B-like Fe-S oxidoreductase